VSAEVLQTERETANRPACSDSQSADAAEENLVDVLGFRFQDRPIADVAETIVQDAIEGNRRNVFFVNAHCLNVAAKNPEYLAVLADSPWVYADGAGMALGASINGVALQNNLNGTDLFPLICGAAARKNVPIALLGAKPGVAEKCATKMQALLPGLDVVWHEHGYLDPDLETSRLPEIAASGARILFVAKGVPMQELWIQQYAESMNVPVVLGVGALFDFYSGDMPRAPLLVRKLRMEWAFRLLMEPRRMFRRYVVGNPEFIYRALKARFSRKTNTTP